jgi:hypothetical protein
MARLFQMGNVDFREGTDEEEEEEEEDEKKKKKSS